MYEARDHTENSFITLTFDDEHLPDIPSIQVADLQKFFKLIRYSLQGKKIRYFASGEYGKQQDPFAINQNLGRPHYHAIVFGHDFERGEVVNTNERGEAVYSSPELEKWWKKGHCSTGPVTMESAAYVARYTCKKIGGKLAKEHYEYIHPETGEVHALRPEFAVQSRGIGRNRFERYKSDFEKGYINANGTPQRIPRAWKKIMLEENNLRYIRSTAKVAREAAKHADPVEARRRLHRKGDIQELRTKALLNRKL